MVINLEDSDWQLSESLRQANYISPSLQPFIEGRIKRMQVFAEGAVQDLARIRKTMANSGV